MTLQMTLLDIFAGIGGFSLAFHQAGFETLAFIEWNKTKQIVLKDQFPGKTIYGDIDEFNADEFLRTHGRPDVIAGGVPCQPASTLGKRLGTADHRWKWPQTIRLVRELRPRFCVFENPPALLTLESGGAINGIMSAMAALGYDGMWDVIPAAAFGAGHWRERLGIVFTDANNIDRRAGTGGDNGTEIDHENIRSLHSNPDQPPGQAESRSDRELRSAGQEGIEDNDSSGAGELDASDAVLERRSENGQRLSSGESTADDLRRQSAAGYRKTLSTDANDTRSQGHAGDGVRDAGRSGSDRPAPASYILPDLRNRVTGPAWWHEAQSGIPVLVSGLPAKLVEAASLCIGDSVVPQAWVPIAKTIAAKLRQKTC